MGLNVVITGSTRGIGRCMAVEFLRRDCRVVVSGRPTEPPADLLVALAAVLKDKGFRFVFNALGDRPETVAAFLVPRMLRNRRNGARIVWLTGPKVIARFLLAPFRHRHLLP